MRWAAPVGVFATAFSVYAATCATTVQGGDSGQFTLLAALGGTAHPPGYPILTLLLSASRWLPFDNPALQSALVSAVCAALALGALTAALQKAHGAVPAALAAGSLAFAPTFWRYAVQAEVFALAALSVALVVWVSWRIAEGARGPRWQLLLGLAVATGIANHHTIVFLAPLAIWAWVTAFDGRPEPKGVAAVVVGFVPGFLAYLLLMWPGGGWRWGDTSTLEGVVHAFLRRDFGTFSLTIHDAGVRWYEHPLLYLQALPRNGVGVFLVAAVLGAVAGVRGPRAGFHRALLASWLLSGVGFLAMFNVPADGLGEVMAARFHIPSLVLLVPMVALGIQQVGRARLVQPLLAVALVLHVALGWTECDKRHDTVLEDYVHNTLTGVAPDALVLGNTDGMFYGVLYVQEVQGVRPDVVFLHPLMLAWPWYRDRVAQRHPSFEPDALAEPLPIPQVVRASWPHRPVYVTRDWLSMGSIAGQLPAAYPAHGTLMRLVGPGEELPAPASVEREMAASVDGFQLRADPALATAYGGWAADQYASAWVVLGQAYAAAGDDAGVERCRVRAERFRPQDG